MKPILFCTACFTAISPISQGVTVTTVIDEDDGLLGGGTGISLREAVKYPAEGDSIITFYPKLSGKTIRLTRDILRIDRSLTIDASALPVGITLSGDKTGNGRTKDDITVMMISQGTVFLNSLKIVGGGAVKSGGGITAYEGSSPIHINLTKCTVADCWANRGGGIYLFGQNSSLTIRDSTFFGNTATELGGAIFLEYPNTQIQNSTFSGNSARNGGAIRGGKGTLSLEHVTISANTASVSGGGIHSVDSLIIQSSIVAGNTAPADADVSGKFTGKTNIISGTPRLATLGDYGGPTQTMPPVPGSPAINKAGDTGTALTTDQRGLPISNNYRDIGAAEYHPSDLARFWTMDFDGDGSPFGVENALGTDNFIPDPGSPRNLTAPVRNAAGHPTLRFAVGFTLVPTHWVLKRSPDLNPNHFQEIYRYDGNTDTAAAGIDFLRNSSYITVTDTNPLPGQGFYRFEAWTP